MPKEDLQSDEQWQSFVALVPSYFCTGCVFDLFEAWQILSTHAVLLFTQEIVNTVAVYMYVTELLTVPVHVYRYTINNSYRLQVSSNIKQVYYTYIPKVHVTVTSK